ncbi:Uncharacterized protein APZ42_004839, partial [Daphnia magna]
QSCRESNLLRNICVYKKSFGLRLPLLTNNVFHLTLMVELVYILAVMEITYLTQSLYGVALLLTICQMLSRNSTADSIPPSTKNCWIV